MQNAECLRGSTADIAHSALCTLHSALRTPHSDVPLGEQLAVCKTAQNGATPLRDSIFLEHRC